MPDPQFDPSTGRWYIRYHISSGERVKKLLPKQPGWKRSDRRPRATPPEVLLYARRYQDIDAKVKAGMPVADILATPIADHLRDYARSFALAGKQPGSCRELKNATRVFLNYCRAEGLESLQSVTPAHCRGFMERAAEAKKKHSTIAKWKGMLSPAFNRARKDGLIARNPWEDLEVPGERRKAESPFWTDDETARIEAALNGWARDLFVIGVHCGFRIDALLNLRWRDVLWSDPRHPGGSLVCRAESSKNGRRYRVPLFPRLRENLGRMHDDAGKPGPDALLFPGRVAGRPMTRESIDDHIRRAMKRAGVADRGRRCHAMRETFGTRCGAKGVNARTLMAWMGHSSLRQTTKYVHFDRDSEASEVAKLDS